MHAIKSYLCKVFMYRKKSFSCSENYSPIHKKSGVQYSIAYNATKTELNHRFFYWILANYSE